MFYKNRLEDAIRKRIRAQREHLRINLTHSITTTYCINDANLMQTCQVCRMNANDFQPQ